MSLRENVHTLTREHLTTGPEGKLVKVPALLDQLQEAVNTSSGGKAGGVAAGVPINTHVIDFQRNLDTEARNHQREMTGTSCGTLTSILQSWADIDGEWADYLDHVTLDWCDKIRSLITPPKVYRPHAPCPHCGARFHGEDRQPCLTVNYRDQNGDVAHPGEWTMTCAACEVSWAGDDLGVIAHALSAA